MDSIDLVISSDLKRAVDSADYTFKAPQLALEVITKGISWNEAIEKDWRKIKAWQPGWEYLVK